MRPSLLPIVTDDRTVGGLACDCLNNTSPAEAHSPLVDGALSVGSPYPYKRLDTLLQHKSGRLPRHAFSDAGVFVLLRATNLNRHSRRSSTRRKGGSARLDTRTITPNWWTPSPSQSDTWPPWTTTFGAESCIPRSSFSAFPRSRRTESNVSLLFFVGFVLG